MQTERLLITVDVFWRMLDMPEYQDRKLELINGEIIEVAPMPDHGLSSSVIHGTIFAHLTGHPIGKVVFEVDFYVPEDPGNTRRPDVAFITLERPMQLPRHPHPRLVRMCHRCLLPVRTPPRSASRIPLPPPA